MLQLFEEYSLWSLCLILWLAVAVSTWKKRHSRSRPWYKNRRVNKSRIQSLASKRSGYWIAFKLVILATGAFSMFFLGPFFTSEAQAEEMLPLWIAPVMLIYFAFGTLFHLRHYPASRLYLEQSAWPAFPFAILTDPLPIWHWSAWAVVALSLPLLARGLVSSRYQLLLESLPFLCAGLGVLLGIAIYPSFIAETRDPSSTDPKASR